MSAHWYSIGTAAYMQRPRSSTRSSLVKIWQWQLCQEQEGAQLFIGAQLLPELLLSSTSLTFAGPPALCTMPKKCVVFTLEAHQSLNSECCAACGGLIDIRHSCACQAVACRCGGALAVICSLTQLPLVPLLLLPPTLLLTRTIRSAGCTTMLSIIDSRPGASYRAHDALHRWHSR